MVAPLPDEGVIFSGYCSKLKIRFRGGLPVGLWQNGYSFFPGFFYLSVHFEITGTVFFPVHQTETMGHVFQLEKSDEPQQPIFPCRRGCHLQRPEESRSGFKVGVISDLNFSWTQKGKTWKSLRQPPRSFSRSYPQNASNA